MSNVPLCKKCGYEAPEGSNFCPNCGTSIPASQSPRKDYRSSKEKICPKCGAVMRAGFVVERDSPAVLWTLGEGIYWTPGEAGMIGERVALKAYACPQCGYIEHYVRRLQKDREIILSAPTTYEE